MTLGDCIKAVSLQGWQSTTVNCGINVGRVSTGLSLQRILGGRVEKDRMAVRGNAGAGAGYFRSVEV